MTKMNHDILRMELQISELIRVVANLHDRLQKLEAIENDKKHFHHQGIPRPAASQE